MYKQVRSLITGDVDATVIVRIADGACIPTDPDNRDYKEYLEWVALGNTPTPPPPAQTALELTTAQRQQAIDLLDAADSQSKAQRSLLLALIDELNELRQRFNDLQADVQSSANIAQVKPKWALRLPLPARTSAGVKAALAGKITSGAAD